MLVNTKFKPLAVLVCMLLVLLALVCGSQMEADAATYTGSCGAEGDNVTYTIDTETGVLTISGTGAMADYDSYSSTPWCSNIRLIKTVVITEGVTRVGSYAFSGCGRMTDVTISDSVTSIGKNAFSDCIGLTTVIMGDSVTSIGNSAFSFCVSLTNIKMSDGIKNIGEYAFHYCIGLTSIVIPKGINNIDRYAFVSCYRLAEVINRSSFNIIPGNDTFGGVAENAIEVHNGEIKIINVNDYLFYTFNNTNYLLSYTGTDKDLVLPDDYNGETYQINNCAFYESDITSLIMSNGVTRIGENAFFECGKLTTLVIGDNVTTIASYAFTGCNGLTTVTIPESVTGIGFSAFYCCYGLTGVNFEATDGWWLGYHEMDTSGIEIPADDLYYPSSALDCLMNIYDGYYWHRTVPHSHKYVGTVTAPTCTKGGYTTYACECGASYVASYTDKLAHVYNEELICDRCGHDAALGRGTCGNDLTWILTQEGVLTVSGTGAMMNVDPHSVPWYSLRSYVKTVVINDGVTSVGSYAFAICKNLTDVTIPDSVKRIEAYAFYDCYLISGVTIPDSVTSIGDCAFYSCSSLTSVTIPNGVTIIGGSAFSCCDSMTSVTIGDNVTSIGDYAFSGCIRLSSVTMGDGVTSIGAEAFASCFNLKSVVIPRGVTSIGNNAFDYCYRLAEVINRSSLNIVPGKETYGEVAYYAVEVHSGESKIVNVNDYLFYTYNGINYLLCYIGNDTVLFLPDSYNGENYQVYNNAFYDTYVISVTISNGVIGIGLRAFENFNLKSVVFETSDGWWVATDPWTNTGDTAISATLLSDPSTAVRYLNSTYVGFGWYRIVSHSHEYTSVIIAPTCTEAGYTTYTCECGDSYVADEVAALGHNFVSLVTAPTCTTQGFTTYVCRVCYGGYAGDFVDMIAHEYTDGYCAICGKAEPLADGLFAWQLTKDGVLIISGKGAMPNYGVDDVPWSAYKTQILKVVIDEGITTVGRCAFYGCTKLRSVSLPSTLTKISEYAFYDCRLLNEIVITEGVTEIGAFAFRRCDALTVEFCVSYGWHAGDIVLSATEIVNMGSDYLTLGYYKEVWIRDTMAEEEAVDGYFVVGGMCNTEVKWTLTYIDDAKTKMKLTVSGNGAMPDYGTGAAPWYEYLNAIIEIEVCGGVTNIGRCAFYGLKFVKNVTIADGIESIGDYAFNGCFSLMSIEIPDSVTYISESAFTKTGLEVVPTV